MPLFSNRLPDSIEPNALTRRLEQLRAEGKTIVDLTESNPTRAGIAYQSGWLSALAGLASLRYEPTPAGLDSARRAVAGEYTRRGVTVDPVHVVLSASTSEAYSWLFKLCCNPGERVLVPRPSYPLFEHLARLEGVTLDAYDLRYHGRWEIDMSQLHSAHGDVRAVVVVSPNNPTGSCLLRSEVDAMMALCAERGWMLIADEVFVDFLLEAGDVATDLAANASCLTVSLGGLSKSVGLPQLKLAWMLVGGPTAKRDRTLAALDIIADSFLSVSTPVQQALPMILSSGATARDAIRERLRTNLSILRSTATEFASCDVPLVDGGWSAVIRVPAVKAEEAIALELLEEEGILLHPGFFFDFQTEAYLVVSLLVPSEVFRASIPRVFAAATR